VYGLSRVHDDLRFLLEFLPTVMTVSLGLAG
jgi:hypothetical protein